jgi:hypothetical protein
MRPIRWPVIYAAVFIVRNNHFEAIIGFFNLFLHCAEAGWPSNALPPEGSLPCTCSLTFFSWDDLFTPLIRQIRITHTVTYLADTWIKNMTRIRYMGKIHEHKSLIQFRLSFAMLFRCFQETINKHIKSFTRPQTTAKKLLFFNLNVRDGTLP